MATAPKKAGIIGSRAQTIVGPARVIDANDDAYWQKPEEPRHVAPTGMKPDGVIGDPARSPASPPAAKKGLHFHAVTDTVMPDTGIEIEDIGPEIPTCSGTRKYPVHRLTKPDSFFFVPHPGPNVGSTIREQARRAGIKVTIRSNFEHTCRDGVTRIGVGVWRLA